MSDQVRGGGHTGRARPAGLSRRGGAPPARGQASSGANALRQAGKEACAGKPAATQARLPLAGAGRYASLQFPQIDGLVPADSAVVKIESDGNRQLGGHALRVVRPGRVPPLRSRVQRSVLQRSWPAVCFHRTRRARTHASCRAVPAAATNARRTAKIRPPPSRMPAPYRPISPRRSPGGHGFQRRLGERLLHLRLCIARAGALHYPRLDDRAAFSAPSSRSLRDIVRLGHGRGRRRRYQVPQHHGSGAAHDSLPRLPAGLR